MKSKAVESKVICTLMVLLSSFVFVYYVGFVWHNTIFFNGYPRFGSPPSPGTFTSVRYGIQWVFTYLLSVNALPPLFLLVACLFEKRVTGIWLHAIAIFLAGFISLVVAVYFTIWVYFFQTNSQGSGYSISNDYRWCHSFFNQNPDICPNTTPFVPAPTELTTNGEFKQHIGFSWAFVGLAGFHVATAAVLKKWKIWENI